MLVSICIITYQRPEGLKQLLDRLDRLEFKSIEPPQIEVVVIDNDLTGAACKFCEQIEPKFKWSLKSEVESQRGISYARNHAIAAASKDAKFIVTIDDDEVPEPQWLEELLLVQEKYQADIVTGPVLPVFRDDVPDWVKKGKFFDRLRHPTGYLMQVAFTNNVLVHGESLRKFDKPFAERFALTGGEDVDLFMRLYKAGSQIVWANDAIVHESIPPNRTTIAYILQRGYRAWGSHSIVERELYPSVKLQSIRIIKGMGLIAIGLFLLIPSVFQGQHAFVKALQSICRGAGTLSGLLGIHYEEYK